MTKGTGLTYAGTGVDYGIMDPHKRDSMRAALETDHWVERFGFKILSWTRGESVTLLETPWGYLGLVIEGLGTKNLVADALYALAASMESVLGRSYYDHVGQCNAAMAFNDAITLGAMPIMYGQYLALGSPKWLENEDRRRDLIAGTKKACDLARCSWVGGETPTLMGVIVSSSVDLAGGTVGWIPDKRRLINPANIVLGDAIVIIESSGIHANGLTLARKIADSLPIGYLTPLSDGRPYGEALLDPTHIYVCLVEDCFEYGLDIHYAVNVTGHGWRKLMRANRSFTYVIDTLPTQLPIFDFIQEHGPVDDREAYGNLNMGAGFALYVPAGNVSKVILLAKELGQRAFLAGQVEAGEKQVVIRPKGLTYKADTLAVR